MPTLNSLPPLLISSCAFPNAPSTALQNKDERIELTIKGIEAWLKIEPNIQIVICDGSGFDFGPPLKARLPYANIECLAFQNSSDLVQKLGKGYGEGEIVEYALRHSKYLQACNYFAKCTAKLWVQNFHECLQDWNGQFICDIHCSNVTKFKPFILNHLDTRFYISAKDFYLQNLIQTHAKVNEIQGNSLEQCFKKVANDCKLTHYAFSKPVMICGVSGSTALTYKPTLMNNLKERLKKSLLKIRSDLISNSASKK